MPFRRDALGFFSYRGSLFSPPDRGPIPGVLPDAAGATHDRDGASRARLARNAEKNGTIQDGSAGVIRECAGGVELHDRWPTARVPDEYRGGIAKSHRSIRHASLKQILHRPRQRQRNDGTRHFVGLRGRLYLIFHLLRSAGPGKRLVDPNLHCTPLADCQSPRHAQLAENKILRRVCPIARHRSGALKDRERGDDEDNPHDHHQFNQREALLPSIHLFHGAAPFPEPFNRKGLTAARTATPAPPKDGLVYRKPLYL